MRKGIGYAALAYTLWGLLPLYWHALHDLPALEILAHRIVWALLVTLLLVSFRGGWAWLPAALRSRRVMLVFVSSALLLTGNWFVYIWAVNAGYLLETSLGYFINPLVNVLLGVLFLRERLRPGQLAAILTALAGVLYLTFQYGALPWIALTLALSFGAYGLLRKTAALGSLEGLTLETLLLAPPAIALLAWWTWQGSGGLAHDGTTLAWLIGLGPMTSIPLLLFAAGARRISLATLGVLQYVSPTIQLLLGLWIFGESLSGDRLVGFTLTWLALVVFSVEGWLHARRR